MRPLISVIVPAFNAEHYLVEAIASVQAQDYESTEILVIDDGSLDRTAEIASSLKGVHIPSTRPQRRGSGA